MDRPWDEPLERVKGVGPKRAQLFARLGVSTVGDLLYLLPRRYIDMAQLTPIAEAQVGRRVTVRGRVLAVKESRARGRRLQVVKALLGDGTGTLGALWFNAGRRLPLAQRLAEAGEIILHGVVTGDGPGPVIKGGEWDPVARDSLHLKGLVPVYPGTEGLPGRVIRASVAEAVAEWAPNVGEPLPGGVRDRLALPELGEALRCVHFPESAEQAAAARRRLAFDELLLFQLLLGLRRAWREEAGRGIAFTGPRTLSGRFRAQLPFALTGDQERALAEIEADMAAARPMERLVLGDVGAGKTVVAASALVRAVECGYQGALMAPTAILAEQHHRTLVRLLGELPIKVALLTSAVSERERRQIAAQLAAGEVDVAVGTHSLIGEGVDFHRLGLVVVDEQHRFGVRQRAALAGKGMLPDVLVMSATPIPRTLALAFYGDLEVSTLATLPPGRRPVKTVWFEEKDRPRIYRFITEQAAQGLRTYVVCPVVEEGGEGQAGVKNVVQEAERLGRTLPGVRVGLVHGQMSPDEKGAVMQAFREGRLDVLVATTVIELGVDVPEATVMVVENADRFGLAQLHQLRGRVGRGTAQGYCVIFGEPRTPAGQERMKAFARTASGFDLAEADLRLRGPGEFFGTRQAGLPEFRLPLAELFGDPRLLEEARLQAREFLAEDPGLAGAEHRGLAAALARRFGDLLQKGALEPCG